MDGGQITDGMKPLRDRLRDETMAAHEAVDAHLSRYDLSDREQYIAFLVEQARVVPIVERMLDRAGLADYMDDWPERRREQALEIDLHALDRPMPTPVPFPPLDGLGRMVGACYVMEGSRLGAKFLARGVGEDFPKAFLTHGEDQRFWGSFVKWMKALDLNGEEADRAVSSAAAVFALYGTDERRTAA